MYVRMYVHVWSGVWRSRPPLQWYGLVGLAGAGVCEEGVGAVGAAA